MLQNSRPLHGFPSSQFESLVHGFWHVSPDAGRIVGDEAEREDRVVGERDRRHVQERDRTDQPTARQVLVVLPCVAAEGRAVLRGAHRDAVLVVDVTDRRGGFARGEAEQAVEAGAAEGVRVVAGAVEAVLADAGGDLDGHRDRQLEVTGAVRPALGEDRRPLAHVELAAAAEVLRVAVGIVGADVALVLARCRRSTVSGSSRDSRCRGRTTDPRVARRRRGRCRRAGLRADQSAARWCHTRPA